MGVKTLQNLACNAVYEEILRSSLLCHNHPQKGKPFPCLPFSSVLSSSRPPLSAQEKSSRVRIHLDYYLKGTMNDKIRKQLVQIFYQDDFKYEYIHMIHDENRDDEYRGHHGYHCNIDVFSFLDSVLDGSFEELKTRVSFPGIEPNPELFSMISYSSPQLQKLELYFKHCESTWMGKVETLMGPLSSLEHLTNLNLSLLLNHKLRQTVLSLVGKYCPLLTHLGIIRGYPDGNQEILSLILGETLSSFFPNAGYDDKEIDHLKVPAERLTPICSTLRELNYDDCRYDGDPKHRKTISDSTVAFALRHLPLLEYFGSYPVPTSLGIQKLSNIKAEAIAKLRRNEKMIQLMIEPEERMMQLELMLKRQITNIPDFLLLTKLDDVNLLNYHLLRAVGSICPHLKHVVFITKGDHSSKNDADYDSDNADYSDTIGDSESIQIESKLTICLKKWPTLLTIEFNNINASIYHKTVLKVFGPNLKNLIFRHDSSTRPVLADFTPCICLESLVFQDFLKTRQSSWDIGLKPTHLTADTYLPKLKHFTSGTCLGPSWSKLFEEKTSLVSLDLHCCHIGIDHRVDKSLNQQSRERPFNFEDFWNPTSYFCCYHASDEDTSLESMDQYPSKRLKLNHDEEVTSTWPELEILTIRQRAGLSPTLLNLLPRLPKMKKVALIACGESKNDPVLLSSVMDKLAQRDPPVQIDFIKFFYFE